MLAVTVICAIVPFEPAWPARGLDDSWSLGLNEAVAQGMAFGRDILFTFGPYVSIFSRAYHPATDWLMILGSLTIAGIYCYVLVLVTRSASRALPWMLTAAFALMVSRDTLLMSCPFVVGLYLARTDRMALRTVAVLAAPLGVLPLVKGSFAVLCGLVTIVAALSRWTTGDRRGFVAAIASSTLTLAAFWLIAGQPPQALPGYVKIVLGMAAGYSDAMAVPGNGFEVIAYIAASVSIITSVLYQQESARSNRWSAATFTIFLFVVFKSGFVRHDSHALICSSAIMFSSVLCTGTSRWRWRYGAFAIAVAAWLFIDASYDADHWRNAQETYASAARGLVARAGFGASYPDQFRTRLQAIATKTHLPPLTGSSDIYSYNQTDLIAAGVHWTPRPVIQSYAAYDRFLAEANRDYLLGSNAPDSIVFRVQPIDWRLPALEDGSSWWPLLSRYEPASFDGDAMILRHRMTSNAVAHLSAVRTTTGKLNRNVRVPKNDTLLFAEIDLEPSMLGRLIQVLYKVAPVLVTINLESGAEITYRFIPSMGRLGFLISPLVETTQEMATLYGSRGFLARKRVASFKILPTGWAALWKRSFKVEFRQLDVVPTVDPRQYYRFAAQVQESAVEGGACEGVLDKINNAPAPGELSTAGILTVSGWVAHRAGVPANVVALALTDEHGTTYLYATERDKRQDVADYFHDPKMIDTGYATTIDISERHGRYLIGPAIDLGDHFAICPKRNHTVIINPVH